MTRLLAIAVVSLCPLALMAQAQSAAVKKSDATTASPQPVVAAAVASAAHAVRATRAPVLDGREDDEVWSRATNVGEFRQFDPAEDGPTRFRTEAKIAYDDRNLFVFVRAFQNPDSIVSLLSRRDVRTPSDWIKVSIDSYFDRRSGYEFAVNPAGVKRDYYTFNDNEEDGSWDGVWEVATRIDSVGWTAEFRIPFNQLRFTSAAEHTFGLSIWRDIASANQRDGWPVYRRSRPGIASQFTPVSGFVDIPTPRRLEVAPYTVGKNESDSRSDGTFGRRGQFTGGADLKYGLTSNLTVDATINPDFGQVEADPAVLNLSAFETLYQEKRPFFIEGTGIFRFDVSCNNGACTGLFYSRRIGRSPSLAPLYGDAHTPTATSIVGATKLTGRLGSGLSVGVLDAVTQREVGAPSPSGRARTVEPGTNYVVARLQQDLRNGQTGVGLIATGVDRSLDDWSTSYLRRQANTAGLDFRHQFFNRVYELTGFVAGSRVAGDTGAIRRTQLNTTHLFQRPDDDLSVDPTRTSLTGDAEQLNLNRIGGQHVRFSTGYSRFSPGFEINDVGYLQRADAQSVNGWMGVFDNTPKSLYRGAQINFNGWNGWTVSRDLLAGHPLMTDQGFNVNGHVQFRNSWWAHVGGNLVNALAATYCVVSCTRGGPAIRQSPDRSLWAEVDGDQRKRIAPSLFAVIDRSDFGRSFMTEIDPVVDFRLASNFTLELGPSLTRNTSDAQYVDVSSYTGNAPYLFGRMDQTTVSLRTRIDYTVTPTLSLQVYAQPFVTAGRFSQFKMASQQPRADRYDDRYVALQPTRTASTTPGVPSTYSVAPNRDGVQDIQFDDPDFNYKQLRSNVVMRWEYRPGSTIFLVWTQGRQQGDEDLGTYRTGRDFRNLFDAHPDNTLLVKASYWFSL